MAYRGHNCPPDVLCTTYSGGVFTNHWRIMHRSFLRSRNSTLEAVIGSCSRGSFVHFPSEARSVKSRAQNTLFFSPRGCQTSEGTGEACVLYRVRVPSSPNALWSTKEYFILQRTVLPSRGKTSRWRDFEEKPIGRVCIPEHRKATSRRKSQRPIKKNTGISTSVYNP